jgi:hypothetical protein
MAEQSNEMSITQKRAFNRAEFQRRFGKYWLLYLVLCGTAVLSAVSGILLPFRPDSSGYVTVNIGLIIAGLYYAFGFLTNGEGATFFWQEKLTDQDPDNTAQKIVAWIAITVSVLTTLTTAAASAALIAFWLGEFNVFAVFPSWAQKWIVWAIPVMWVFHYVMAAIFKATSEEDEYKRETNAIVNRARNDMIRAKEQARADWWSNNAPAIARKLGEMEAQDELDAYEAKIEDRKSKRDKSRTASEPTFSYSKDVGQLEVSDNGHGAKDFQTRQR